LGQVVYFRNKVNSENIKIIAIHKQGEQIMIHVSCLLRHILAGSVAILLFGAGQPAYAKSALFDEAYKAFQMQCIKCDNIYQSIEICKDRVWAPVSSCVNRCETTGTRCGRTCFHNICGKTYKANERCEIAEETCRDKCNTNVNKKGLAKCEAQQTNYNNCEMTKAILLQKSNDEWNKKSGE
jgi:hypothetical protein